MKKIVPAPDQHEQAFVARYAALLRWALHLTEHDRQQAEDLLHDAFIQFTVARPDLATIRNLDNYLFGVLRMLRFSQLRRAARRPVEPLALIEYDSAEIGLRMLEPGERLTVHEELRAVCRYACARKDSSKAGSVLILRFFHGYYPSEIGRLLCSTRKVVDMRLQAARREAKLYTAEPDRLSFIHSDKSKASGKERRPTMPVRTADELLQELRGEIFRARPGDCPAPAELQHRYNTDNGEALDTSELSHLVSCPQCLEASNQILGLPSLAERFPADTLAGAGRSGNGGNSDDNSGGGPPAAGGGGLLRQTRRRAQELFEHRPQELRIAVNGHVIATQKLNAEINELALELNSAEQADFIEVFSEQGLRLALLPLAAALGETAAKTVNVTLSDERSLVLRLNSQAAQPMLHIVYCDPLLETNSAEVEELEFNISKTLAGEHRAGWRAWTRWFDWGATLRPAFVALLLMTVAGAYWLFRPTPTKVSAAELLQKSIAAETQMAVPRQVVQRKFTFEERNPVTGQTLTQQRLEVWQSADRHITVHRLYDQRNKLIAGEWRQSDGASKVYQHAAKQASNATALWRYALLTPDFAAFAAQAEATVEEQTDAYTLNYQFRLNGIPFAGTRLVKAMLTIRKTDYRTIAQTLLVQTDDLNAREYRFVESSFARLAASEVADTIFQPEPELLGPNARVFETKAAGLTANTTKAAETAAVSQPSASATELAALEIEARYLLDQVNANLGEQVTVRRTGDAKLQVQALVETERRKQELLTALAPLRAQPAVTLDVATYAEAARRQPSVPATSITSVEAELTQNQIPAGADLRRYFAGQAARQSLAGQAVEAWIENQLTRFANRAQESAARPLRHAWALKNLVDQVAPSELPTLSQDAQAKWRKLVITHAYAIQRETERLRAELQPIFFAELRDNAELEVSGETDLKRLAEQLVRLTSEHDEIVSRAFSKSPSNAANSAGAVIRAEQFRQSLHLVERLAARIVKEQ